MAKTFRWTVVKDREEMKEFYERILPGIREAARTLGYAIGAHGSFRRDMDLIAVAWTEQCADKDALARAIHQAACGLENTEYHWEQKPHGRLATSFPVCFPEWNEPNVGHIDLSIAPKPTAPGKE